MSGKKKRQLSYKTKGKRVTMLHKLSSSPRAEPEDAVFSKFLPCNNMDDSDSDDPYSSDQFRIYKFKVRKCNRSRSHDWTDCPFAHPGEKSRRRDPRRYRYSGTLCSEFRKGHCGKGDNCEFSHGVFECWLHPSRYRTEACKNGKNCKRKVCFFAHSTKQLRIVPDTSSPPPSMVDSPIAAMEKRLLVASELPEEILIDIFSRLPAKSAGKCRCLSKPWRTILSSPNFIKSHLNRKTHEQNLFLITRSYSSHTITDIKNGTVSRELDLLDDWIEVLGSCDGLILLLNEEDDKILVNPITLEIAQVPNSPLALETYERVIRHGFGYDSSVDDYKIVTLSYYVGDEFDTFVDVFYAKTGVWKRLENSPYDFSDYEYPSGAYLNGCVHWLANCKESEGYSSAVIVAFDFAHEVFVEMPVPTSVKVELSYSNKLVVLGGCLCIVGGQRGTDLWIMKDYGSADSWTLFSIVSGHPWFCRFLKPLCYIGDDEVVLITDDDNLLVYNLKAGFSMDMIVDGDQATFMDGGVFMGSLVSPFLGGNPFGFSFYFLICLLVVFLAYLLA